MHGLKQAEQQIADFVESFHPAVDAARDDEALVAGFGRLERLVGAGKDLARRQVPATGAWKSAGDAGPRSLRGLL